MPFTEVTITLEDVATPTDLAIDGDVIVVDIPDQDLRELCLRQLGRAPTDLAAAPLGLLGLGKLSMSDLLRHHQRLQSSLHELMWRPYFDRAEDFSGTVIQSDTFRAVVSLICSSAMWHHPDRVLRKFGMIQDPPHPRHPAAEIRFFLS
ncbi:unnamed protein product [Linum tenue]|uniref:Aminotransferase-like plant mobile domain-containing protein n=1 Tax=Linum tenue TaxID=586396 RepID=A0AAV0Q4V3_9ROSI|nr:unnamed protein product [Linum tenue]